MDLKEELDSTVAMKLDKDNLAKILSLWPRIEHRSFVILMRLFNFESTAVNSRTRANGVLTGANA